MRLAATPRFYTTLLGTFALVGLLITAVGFFGVLSFLVAQRTREIGVRMALGATRTNIASEVLGLGLRLVTIGIAIGIAGAWACAHLLSSLLYGVRPTDAIAFVAAAVVLASVALLASCIPARRATAVDPIVALHSE